MSRWRFARSRSRLAAWIRSASSTTASSALESAGSRRREAPHALAQRGVQLLLDRAAQLGRDPDQEVVEEAGAPELLEAASAARRRCSSAWLLGLCALAAGLLQRRRIATWLGRRAEARDLFEAVADAGGRACASTVRRTGATQRSTDSDPGEGFDPQGGSRRSGRPRRRPAPTTSRSRTAARAAGGENREAVGPVGGEARAPQVVAHPVDVLLERLAVVVREPLEHLQAAGRPRRLRNRSPSSAPHGAAKDVGSRFRSTFSARRPGRGFGPAARPTVVSSFGLAGEALARAAGQRNIATPTRRDAPAGPRPGGPVRGARAPRPRQQETVIACAGESGRGLGESAAGSGRPRVSAEKKLPDCLPRPPPVPAEPCSPACWEVPQPSYSDKRPRAGGRRRERRQGRSESHSGSGVTQVTRPSASAVQGKKAGGDRRAHR